MKFIPCNLHLQVGDVISSKKGILQQSAISNNNYLVKKLKVIGNGIFEVIGDKEEVDINEVKE